MIRATQRPSEPREKFIYAVAPTSLAVTFREQVQLKVWSVELKEVTLVGQAV